jgi:hypothetical protein
MIMRNCQSKKARQYNDKGNQKLSWLTVSDYSCHYIFWPSLIDSFWLLLSLYFLAFFDWQFLITLVIVMSGNQRRPDNIMTRVIRNCQSKKARQYNNKGNQKLSIKEVFLITLVIVMSGHLWLTVYDYPCHCIVWPSLIDSFWLPLYCLDFFDWQFLITIVFSGLLWLTVSDYHCHCIVWPSLIKDGQTLQWQG